MEHVITIASRFNGPPDSGNGGYVCGLVASLLDGPAEVTLRSPPPLERPLTASVDSGEVRVLDGDTLVAEATSATVDEEPPATVSRAEAEEASRGYAGFESHAFPTCFVCGPRRERDDGLRIFAGPVKGTDVVASPWVPPEDLATDGLVRPEVVWASLDCPSFFGAAIGKPAVLGRLAVDVRAPLRAGDPHVVVGWSRGSEGRKHFSGAAVTTADGAVLAVSRATWVELRT